MQSKECKHAVFLTAKICDHCGAPLKFTSQEKFQRLKLEMLARKNLLSNDDFSDLTPEEASLKMQIQACKNVLLRDLEGDEYDQMIKQMQQDSLKGVLDGYVERGEISKLEAQGIRLTREYREFMEELD